MTNIDKRKGKGKAPALKAPMAPKPAVHKIWLKDDMGDSHIFACRPCVDGHRAPGCGLFKHTDNNRVYIRKPEPGRPPKTCPHAGRNGCKCIENRYMACQPTQTEMAQLRAGQDIQIRMYRNYETLMAENQALSMNHVPVPVAAWTMRGANAGVDPAGLLGLQQAAQPYPVPDANAFALPGNFVPDQPVNPGPYFEGNMPNILGDPLDNNLKAEMVNDSAVDSGIPSWANMPIDYEAQMGNFSQAGMANNDVAHMSYFFNEAEMADMSGAHPGKNNWNSLDNPFGEGPSSNARDGQVTNSWSDQTNSFGSDPGSDLGVSRTDSFQEGLISYSGGPVQAQEPFQEPVDGSGFSALDLSLLSDTFNNFMY